MKSHVQALVIGGGVVGCSVLYHLAKLGWRDVVLCERKELTAGSSWHAAGGFHVLNSDPNMSRLQAYTVRLYEEIQRESGQDIGLHLTGGLNVAATPERWDMLRADQARHRVLGLDTHLIGPDEVRKLCPLMDVTSVLGALHDPAEGHLDPYAATHAYAKAARVRGAEVYRHTRVEAIHPRRDGSWAVVTNQGEIIAEHIVNAGGLWARQVGLLAGVELPVVAMEHHYLLTEPIAEVMMSDREMPLVLDLDGEIYLRQEGKGVLLGVYENGATPWSVNGTPWDYGESELLPPNLERLTDSLEKGFRRFPTLSQTGIRKIVNGPFTFSPDGNPLVGPVPGLRNYWVACGVMAGFAQGGGVGLALAQWMIHGEPDYDIDAMDVARFGSFATQSYTIARAREFYARRFQIAYPNETWPAGRPSKLSAAHATLQSANAVFGVSYGLEIPLYFAPSKTEAREIPTLGRSSAFEVIAEECRAARGTVALLDTSSYARYQFSGRGAAMALDRLLAGTLPQPGFVAITPMLSPRGRLMGDLITLSLREDEYWLIGPGSQQSSHMRWFAQHSGPETQIENLTDVYAGIALFGPRSRAVLERISGQDVSNEAFPLMSVRRMDIELAPAVVARLSILGELGYEIYVPIVHAGAVFSAIEHACTLQGGRLAGLYAVNSLRLEKGQGIWRREYSRDYTPRMSGLDQFVDYSKLEFIGRAAALEDRQRVPERILVSLAVDADRADAAGYEPIFLGREYVGYTTSGGYGHCMGLSLAMGYVSMPAVTSGAELNVTLLGESRAARLLSPASIHSGVANAPWSGPASA